MRELRRMLGRRNAWRHDARFWLAAGAFAAMQASVTNAIAGATDLPASPVLPHARPAPGARRFSSPAIEEAITVLKRQVADPALRVLVENCLPNTLDTTVHPGEFGGKPDTYVVTGDIDAMWLRDSSAQVWPYLRFARQDARLRVLLEGVVRRQTRMILIDPYANAFMRESSGRSVVVGRARPHRPPRGRG